MIPDAVIERLRAVGPRNEGALPAAARSEFVARGIRALPAVECAVNHWLPVRRLTPVGADVEARHGVAGRAAFAAAIVAELAVTRAPLLTRSGLPASALELYPVAYERLAEYLETKDLTTYWAGDTAFLKDLRIAGGYSVPCGAQDVDLYGAISRLSGLKAIFTSGGFGSGIAVAMSGGPPWFCIHTDERYLDQFNEAGWDRCYRRIADMLRARPTVKGIVGTSWFYDPQLANISPRLDYLRGRPLANGGLLLRHGPGEIHTRRAIQKSETRRKMYEEGRYRPVCYSVIWPRAAMIGWAENG